MGSLDISRFESANQLIRIYLCLLFPLLKCQFRSDARTCILQDTTLPFGLADAGNSSSGALKRLPGM